MRLDQLRGLARSAMEVWPSRRWFVASVCLAAALTAMYVAGAIAVSASRDERVEGDDTIALIPDSEVPRGVPREVEAARARSEELVRKYPHDPRARLDRAAFLLTAMVDLAGAERELRAGLAEEKALALLSPAVASLLRATLARTLALQSRTDEAIATARPLCETESAFKADVAKVGLCPDLAPRRAPGELDAARVAAIIDAANQLKTLARAVRPPRASDPAAGALLDTVLDVSALTRDAPASAQLAGIAQWSAAIGDVCRMYDLPAAPAAARAHLRDYAAELGRCMDAVLDMSGVLLAATANAAPQTRSIIRGMKPSPHQTVMQTVQLTLAVINRPEPTDAWRRVRLLALTGLAERAGPLLTADERHQLATSVQSASRAAHDPEVQTGLTMVASRLGDK